MTLKDALLAADALAGPIPAGPDRAYLQVINAADAAPVLAAAYRGLASHAKPPAAPQEPPPPPPPASGLPPPVSALSVDPGPPGVDAGKTTPPDIPDFDDFGDAGEGEEDDDCTPCKLPPCDPVKAAESLKRADELGL